MGYQLKQIAEDVILLNVDRKPGLWERQGSTTQDFTRACFTAVYSVRKFCVTLIALFLFFMGNRFQYLLSVGDDVYGYREQTKHMECSDKTKCQTMTVRFVVTRRHLTAWKLHRQDKGELGHKSAWAHGLLLTALRLFLYNPANALRQTAVHKTLPGP